MTTEQKLDALAATIARGAWGTSAPWGGADTVIALTPPVAERSHWSSDEIVVTPYARELSWLFEQVRDIAMDVEGYGFFKLGLFPRMGACANAHGSDGTIAELLLATLYEAYVFLWAVEHEDRAIETPVVSLGEPVGTSYETFDFSALPSFYQARGIRYPRD